MAALMFMFLSQYFRIQARLSSPRNRAVQEDDFPNVFGLTNYAAFSQVIDFEYSGYNPRAFDIANHFCEVRQLESA